MADSRPVSDDSGPTSQPTAGGSADSEDEPLLVVDELQTTFYTDKETIRAVDGVSLDIEAGETVGLVGESGSGKSVTARSILGLIDDPGRVEGGSIRFDGHELTDGSWEQHRGDLSIVFQDPINSMNPVYTVGNQIREALRIHQGLRGQEAREEAISLLEAVGIPDAPRRLEEYPHQYSGGMRQRAVIAIALACDPNLLVCDEPTTALDVTIQAQILELLDDLQREEDLGILFITHDMGVIEEIADRVNVMYAGEIVETAPADRLFDEPQHPYTRGLLASIPGRTAEGDELPTIGGEVPTPTSEPDECRFAPRCPAAFDACERIHPEHVDVSSVGTAGVETTDGMSGAEGTRGMEHTAACLLHEDRFEQSPGAATFEANGGDSQ